MAPSGFGPRVIGEDQYEEEEEVREERADVFGERVREPSRPEEEGTATATATAEEEPEEEQTKSATEKLAEALPPGYTFEKAGGYYALYDPDGEPVESDTESGKWQGAKNTLDAAREDQARREEEAQAEAEEEAEKAVEGENEGFSMTQEEARQASVEEVREALENNPSTVDLFMRTEIQRPDGVRQEVVDALEEAEHRRAAVSEEPEDEPREEVLSTLESLRPSEEGEE